MNELKTDFPPVTTLRAHPNGRALLASSWLLALMLAACGGGGGGSGSGDNSSTAVAVTPITVTVAPSSASVEINTNQTFTATVANTSNTAVTWQVDGATGGSASVGTISTAGVYTAPASVPSPAAVTVTAVASVDAAKSATANITITPGPLPPTGITVANTAVGSVLLSWTVPVGVGATATSYLIERCTGASCASFAQIAVATTTMYSDTGLTPATSYSYRVRASDAAGNLSAYSGVATVVTSAAPGSSSGGGGGSTSSSGAGHSSGSSSSGGIAVSA